MEKLHFDLTVDDVNVILFGLAKLPIETAGAVFSTVKHSAEQQLAAQQTQAEDGAGE